MNHQATYSPEDNKLRLYPAYRLDKEEYEKMKAYGFKWAPKQELFVAPAWSPSREDLLIEMAGEIEDEDKSLVQRQEERAERFEVYSENREKDAERARERVEQISSGIPMGQPILIGHHSERHARKHQKQIENGMRKAVNMWEQSKYWEQRAAAALAHAKYKELPRTRARRIKTLEAECRKVQRNLAQCEKFLKTYQDPKAREVKLKDGRELLPALLATYEGGLSYENQRNLEKGELSFEDALAKAIRSFTYTSKSCNRWIAHLNNRITYEKAMLEEQGASELIAPKPRAKSRLTGLPLCNYKAETVQVWNKYHREYQTMPVKEITSEYWSQTHRDYKGLEMADGTHKVRVIMRVGGRYVAFITDKKVTQPPVKAAEEPAPEPVGLEVIEPEEIAPEPEPEPITQLELVEIEAPRVEFKPEPQNPFEAMKQSLKQGVQVVTAPQLFPTPPDLAERVIDEAAIGIGERVLEPSAGMGALLENIPEWKMVQVTAVEINHGLSEHLKAYKLAGRVVNDDFLKCEPELLGQFDKVVMNPPFEKASDIKHINHALRFLKPGGRLVALCADGPRQRQEFESKPGAMYEPLPAGTFKAQGTNVNVALVVIEN